MTKPTKNLAARAAELEAQIEKPKAEPKAKTFALEWRHRDDALPDFDRWIVVSRHKWETSAYAARLWIGSVEADDEYDLSGEYAVGSRRQVKLSGADGWEWHLPKKLLDFHYWAYLSAPTPPKPPPRPKKNKLSPLRERIAMRKAQQ